MRFLLMLLLVACPRTTPEVVPAATVPDTTVVVEATTVVPATAAPIPVDMSAGDGPVDNSNGGEVTVPADVVATAAK